MSLRLTIFDRKTTLPYSSTSHSGKHFRLTFHPTAVIREPSDMEFLGRSLLQEVQEVTAGYNKVRVLTVATPTEISRIFQAQFGHMPTQRH